MNRISMSLNFSVKQLLCGFAAFLAITPLVRADMAYVSGGNDIYAWNTSTNKVSVLTVTPLTLDSLIFDTHGNILYDSFFSTQIRSYNPVTKKDSMLTNKVGPGPADLALSPNGNYLYVSDAGGSTIDKINLTTHKVTSLEVYARPDGLTFDSSGRLFAVLGLDEVAQLNPTTGAVIKSISTPIQPDGLTFNSATGKLYVGSDGGGFYTVSNDLSKATFTNVNYATIDGVASDGNYLYLVERGGGAVQYDLSTKSVTALSPYIAGADDIAPLTGLGSPPTATPEPSSIVLCGVGFVGMAGYDWLRRRRMNGRLHTGLLQS